MDKSKPVLLASVISAFSASLCCTVPLVAAIGGFGSTISIFSMFVKWKWVLIGFSLGILGLSWFFALRKVPDCDCEKSNSFRGKKFLITTTIISVFFLAAPILYSEINSFQKLKSTSGGVHNQILKGQIENCCKIKQK